MRNALLLTVAALLVSGCAHMKKQSKIDEAMTKYVFDAPAADVYKAGEAEFKKMYTTLKKTGKTEGASDWLVRPTKLGEKEYQERSRFTLKVTPQGKSKSMVEVNRESQTDIMGKWGELRKARMGVYEHAILKRMNPTAAAELEKKASVE